MGLMLPPPYLILREQPIHRKKRRQNKIQNKLAAPQVTLNAQLPLKLKDFFSYICSNNTKNFLLRFRAGEN